MTNRYPLHHEDAEPLYVTIPQEEYDRIMTENLKDEISHLRSLNECMRAELERRGVIVIPTDFKEEK